MANLAKNTDGLEQILSTLQNKTNIDLSPYQTKVDSNLEGTLFNGDEEKSVVTAINNLNKNKVASGYVTEAIENIQIGGRNLLRGTAESLTLSAGSTNNYKYQEFTPTVSLKVGQTYSFGADVEVMSGEVTTIAIGFFRSDLQGASSLAHLPIVNGHIAGTVAPIEVAKEKFLLYAGENGSTAGNVVKFSNIKLEKGNKTTDWTLAPEDGVPVANNSNNGQFLRVVGGIPTWVDIPSAEEAIF